MSPRLVVRGGTLLDPAAGIEGVRTVVVEDGKVSEVVEGPGPHESPENTLDATGLWVVPGFIDLHCHLREPGEESKETLASGGRAAAAGGFTSLVAMPNTKPVLDTGALVDWVVRRAADTCPVRVYPTGALSVGQLGETLAELGAMRAAGAVAFTDDGRPVMNAALMRRALEYARLFEVPLMAHEEDLHLAARGVANEGPVATRLGLRGSPAQAEEVLVLRDIALCELTAGRLHIGHVSTAGSVRAIRAAKARGLRVTAEATPHHFTLTDEAIAGYDTHAKMAPPLRGPADVDAVREGLRDGTIDAIATDHAPHGPTDKDVEFDLAANGVIGLETTLPLGLRLVAEGQLKPLRLIELLTAGPARAYGLPGGSLRPGQPGDLAVLDPKAEWTVDPERFFSKSRNSPFKGWKVAGRVEATVVAGKVVHRLAAVRDSR